MRDFMITHINSFHYFCLFAYLFVTLSAKKNDEYETDIVDNPIGCGDDRHGAGENRDKSI